jgi:hypothetical protein
VTNAKSRTIRDPDGPILYSSLEQNLDVEDITLGFSLLVHYSGNSRVLFQRLPTAKRVFVDFHVDAFAAKLYSLDAEAKALFCCGFTP